MSLCRLSQWTHLDPNQLFGVGCFEALRGNARTKPTTCRWSLRDASDQCGQHRIEQRTLDRLTVGAIRRPDWERYPRTSVLRVDVDHYQHHGREILIRLIGMEYLAYSSTYVY